MSKKDIWQKAIKALTEGGITKDTKTYQLLEELLAPKKKGDNYKEPIFDEDGNIVELWCNKHLKYEKLEEFAKNSKNKTGYNKMCKKAEKIWWAYTKAIKASEAEVNNLGMSIMDGKMTIKDAKIEKEKLISEILKNKQARENLPY